jgi:nitroreductase
MWDRGRTHPGVKSPGGSLRPVEIAEAIRGRRTIKAYDPAPVPREVLDELFELARWAPNHHLTNPWRFRVVGPQALEALKQAAGPADGPKLDRAPTLVAVTARQCGDPIQDDEDAMASACATFILLLAAQEHGLSGYWRTPAVLRTSEGRAALRIPDDERVLGLVHLGRARQGKEAPERAPVADVVEYLP